jgi:AcrR family transcriptional regulator
VDALIRGTPAGKEPDNIDSHVHVSSNFLRRENAATPCGSERISAILRAMARNATHQQERVPADDIRRRLMDAAISCVQRWGIEKTGLNDIAREAGCARQTVYNYYKNRDAVIFAALMDSGAHFSIDLIRHINRFEKTDDRIIEAMIYTLKHLPKEPSLQLLMDPKLSPSLNPELFSYELCIETITHIATECLKNEPHLLGEAEEIGEMMTRMFLSLLLIKSPRARNDKQMRQFLHRWLLPGILGSR